MIDQRLFQQEVQHLRRFRHRWLYLLLLPSLAILIPFFSNPFVPNPYYNNGIPDPLLVGSFLAANLFFVFISVRTGFLAAQTINREINGGTWELLHMSGIPLARILWSKWLAVLRVVSLDVLLAVLPRFAFQVMFNVASYRDLYLNIETDFCRQLSGFMVPYCQRQSPGFAELPLPALYQLVLSAITLILFALAGAGLITALGIMAALLARRLGTQMLLLWGVRLGLSLLLLALLTLVAAYSVQTFNYNGVADNAAFCDGGFDYPPADQCPGYYALRNQQRVLETLQVAAMSLVDNGTLPQLDLLNNSYNLSNGTFIPSPGSLVRNSLSAAIDWRCMQ
ncbi:MAG: hypothetical protein U0694_03780 [Anaerolineae bacterium]